MFSKTHFKRLLTAAASLVLVASASATGPVNKCVINGTVTYQQGPCPTDGVIKRAAVSELNAAERKRRAAAAAAKAATPGASTANVSGAFRCDARQQCSQMTSCLEAKYFLAHCPGVKMDGDGNGIPCEQQWCQ